MNFWQFLNNFCFLNKQEKINNLIVFKKTCLKEKRLQKYIENNVDKITRQMLVSSLEIIS